VGTGAKGAVGFLLGLGPMPFPIRPGDVITLGRERDNMILIADAMASRHHAAIACTGEGEVFLKDLNSSNGTYINEKRLTGHVRLQSGDSFRIGGTVMTYISASSASEPMKLVARQSSSFSAQATVVPGVPGTLPASREVTLAGNLSEQSLPQVLQYVAANRYTGEMKVRSQTMNGTIAIAEGNVVYAEAGDKKGMDAILALGAIRSGSFEFFSMDDLPVRPLNVRMPTMQVIFEICRMMDEKGLTKT
jgi:hypothetical protein